MNLWDILIGLAVAAVILLAVRQAVRLKRRGGCYGCTGSCANCGQACPNQGKQEE